MQLSQQRELLEELQAAERLFDRLPIGRCTMAQLQCVITALLMLTAVGCGAVAAGYSAASGGVDANDSYMQQRERLWRRQLLSDNRQVTLSCCLALMPSAYGYLKEPHKLGPNFELLCERTGGSLRCIASVLHTPHGEPAYHGCYHSCPDALATAHELSGSTYDVGLCNT